MPRPNSNSSEAAKLSESERRNEPEEFVESYEKVDLCEDDEDEPLEEEEDPSEEEEVEYEEIEVEEEVSEEIEEGEDTENEVNGNVDEDEKRKREELLSRPPHGSEVYFGGIPLDLSENDLKQFCESVGEVTEVRIMKGKGSNENKGFAFVTFRSLELASKAVSELNNTAIKGKKVKCSISQAKHRLFIGNIPKTWEDKDLRKVLQEIGPGVTMVDLVKDLKGSSNNRGFAFVEYYNNACAEYTRQKMIDRKFKIGHNVPTVSWAEPKAADTSSAASQVRTVYVKNLPKNVTQDQLKKLFDHHGTITKIVLPPAKPGQERNRIGFIHFTNRSSTMNALKNTEKYELDGQVLECSLAKPQTDPKSGGGSNSMKPNVHPTFLHHAGYGMAGSNYGALGAGYGISGIAQSLMYGRGAPPGMAMMPMLLPDGRVGYVLQQGGAQPQTPPGNHRYSNGGGGSGRSGRSGGSSSRERERHSGERRRYHPY